MTLLVKMSNGDTEHFTPATHWARLDDGGLRLFMTAEVPALPALIAEFPPGAWTAVFDPAPKPPVVVDGEGLGKTYRRNPSGGVTVTTTTLPGTYTINAALSNPVGLDPRDEPPASARVPA